MPQTTGTLPEPMLLAGDSPRARRNDHATSHAAADRSQASLKTIRRAVARLVSIHGPSTGVSVNEMYELAGYPTARFDSPRKRAGEMERDGLLSADRSNGREAVYSLTDAGRAFLAEVSA